jgi:hypothetical protein
MGGHREWYPCGAAPDDRTFLLCDTDQYWELRLGDDGKPQSMSAPADIPVAARNNGSNGDPVFAVSPEARLAAVTTATGGIMVLSLVTGATRSWTIPSADGYATSLSWAGDRYVAFQFTSQPSVNDAGGVRLLDTRSAATAALTASRLIISNEGKPTYDGLSGVFNPVITPDGSKVVAAVWTGFIAAELAEFSARTGRLIAVLIPPARMPGHGSPCQVLWTDPSGAHLIADCGTSGVVNGTRFTPVNLHASRYLRHRFIRGHPLVALRTRGGGQARATHSSQRNTEEHRGGSPGHRERSGDRAETFWSYRGSRRPLACCLLTSSPA